MTRPQALRPAEGASEAAPGRPPIARATVTNSTTSSLRLWTMYNVGRGRRVSPPTLARRWSFVIQAAGEPARSPKTLLLVLRSLRALRGRGRFFGFSASFFGHRYQQGPWRQGS